MDILDDMGVSKDKHTLLFPLFSNTMYHEVFAYFQAHYKYIIIIAHVL